MADNPSGFVSWGQQMQLTGDLEDQLYRRALDEASKTQKQAGAALDTSYAQARAANKSEVAGGGQALTTLNQTASYNDYLKLQQQAEQQAKKATISGGNTVSNLMRQQMASRPWGATANFDQGTQALLTRQAQLEQARTRNAQRDEGMYAASQKYAADQSAAADARTRAAKDRAQAEISQLTSDANTSNRGIAGDHRFQDGLAILKDPRSGWDIERLKYGQQMILDAGLAAAKRVMALGGSAEQARKAYEKVVDRREGIRGGHSSLVDDIGDVDALYIANMKGA